jgi:hypothetical protein
MNEAASRVLVILDPEFGVRLKDLRRRQPVWIVDSPANWPVAKGLWNCSASHDQQSGITLFRTDPEASAEQSLLAELSTIDLHCGPYSSESSYTVLEIIGARLNETVRSTLSSAYGFAEFEENPGGFVATRTPESARRCN